MAETKRWWLGMAAIGGALGLSSLLPCLARQSRPMDKDFTVRMPTRIEEPTVPVVAVYYEDWGRVPAVIGPQIIIAVYSDGRTIWSRDSLKGGPPYHIGKVTPMQVRQVLDDLDRMGVFTDPVRHMANVGPDHPFTVIAIADRSRRLYMSSWHEVAEAIPGAVATSSGITSLSGRDRAKVLAAEPESYRHFRQVWDHLRAVIASMVPAEGDDTDIMEFRFKRISAGDPGG